ncbi:MAG: metal-dependent transcriptional regulator [Promethearchaeota archaeon]
MKVLNESYEDYLKAIYLISKDNKGGWVSNSEISNFLSITPASVSEMLHKLKNKGFISWKPRSSIRLTTQGKNIAIQMITNYKNLREFFIKILKINDKGLIDELCCGIEHHITPEIVKALKNLSN